MLIMPIMDTLAMDILTNLQCVKDTAMIDNEFLQTSWHYDKDTKMDVAKVVFIFDGIATIDQSASPDEHKERMTEAVNAARDQVGNAAALFGNDSRETALCFMRWLISCELGAERKDEKMAYTRVRQEFGNIMEGL
jgi:hypothetical protein